MILFISDLHLEPERPNITKAFFHYLNTMPKDTEALYILGDLFEVWIGDDDHSPFNMEVIKHLREAAETTPIHIMRGNRDFLYGEEFTQLSHCQLITDPTIVNFHDQNYLLMHGDSLCTQDQPYMAFREQVRSTEWQQEILSQSLQQRRTLARQIRDASTEVNSKKSMDIMDVTPDEVVKVMAEHQVSRMIHGHTHRPAKHELIVDGKKATRWVLGDWGDYGWQIQIDDKGPQLSQFLLE